MFCVVILDLVLRFLFYIASGRVFGVIVVGDVGWSDILFWIRFILIWEVRFVFRVFMIFR